MFFNRSLISDTAFFDEYAYLYPVQQEAVDGLFENAIPNYDFENNKNFKGKVILPTGTGKTRIAEFIAAKFMNQVYETEKRPSVFGVACHRLMLANNLMRRILYSLKNKFGIGKFKIVVVNSGNYNKFASTQFADDEISKETWKNYGLTKSDIVNYKDLGPNLSKQVAVWKANGFNVMFVVLYQSMRAIINSGVKFDFLFCDESHISSERCYMDCIGEFVNMSDFTIHFTATPTSTDNPNGGMNNEAIYGKDIINKKPLEVVKDKLITPIEVVMLELFDKHGNAKVKSEMGNLSNHDDIINSIIVGYKSMEKKCIANQINAGVPLEKVRKPVMFVSLSGGAVMDEFKNFETEVGDKFLQFRKNNMIDLYMTKSAKGFNGVVDYPEKDGLEFENLSKEDFLEKMDMIENERFGRGAIIINIDQLSEGIDLPAIDGVMLFRNLCDSPAKLLQIIGRSVRRANEDRHLIEDETIEFDDWSRFQKPLSYVYLPISTYSESVKNDICSILNNLYRSYGDIIFRMWTKEDMEGNEEKALPQEDGFQKDKKEALNKDYNFDINSKEYIMNILDGCSSEYELTDEDIVNDIARMVGEASVNGNDEKLQEIFNRFFNPNSPTDLKKLHNNIRTYMKNNEFDFNGTHGEE